MYSVALLIERGMSQLDADQVLALHQGLDGPVTYHLLMPVDEAAAQLSGALGALGRNDVEPADHPEVESQDAQQSFDQTSQEELEASATLLRAAGHDTTATLTRDDPIAALARLVQQQGAAEVIVLTRSHAVAELFHVDWSARARRRLDVPTLHLLEHETFDEQSSGAGEGNTGL